ncbi:MAG: FMN-binding protein [Defluviitaleaceae bacterium]|nr:FMN-binding protein [Defluviitaleaceae bacterium]
MKKVIYLGVFLGLAVSVATAVLAGVNSITAPLIAQAQAEAFREAVEMAFPNADSFSVVAGYEDTWSGYTVQVIEVLEGGERVGFVYDQSVPGFGGPIHHIVGIDNYGVFTNFYVIFHSETPGFVDVIFQDDWVNRIVGLHAGSSYYIDAVSGATATTAPIIRGLVGIYHDFVERR